MVDLSTPSYKIEWYPDGITLKETIFPDGRSYQLVQWKIKELRKTTHKSGALVPVKLVSKQVSKPHSYKYAQTKPC